MNIVKALTTTSLLLSSVYSFGVDIACELTENKERASEMGRLFSPSDLLAITVTNDKEDITELEFILSFETCQASKCRSFDDQKISLYVKDWVPLTAPDNAQPRPAIFYQQENETVETLLPSKIAPLEYRETVVEAMRKKSYQLGIVSKHRSHIYFDKSTTYSCKIDTIKYRA